MRKLAAVLCGFGILFLVGCYSTETADRIERREAGTAANKTRTSIVERIDGEHEAYIGKFETEFSEGTRVGCVTTGYGVSCVPLKGAL
jgi:hypothetical protein